MKKKKLGIRVKKGGKVKELDKDALFSGFPGRHETEKNVCPINDETSREDEKSWNIFTGKIKKGEKLEKKLGRNGSLVSGFKLFFN